MFGEDFVGCDEPQSSALAQWLGGKERLGNHGNLIRRDSHAAIEKGYADILPGVDTHAFAADVDFLGGPPYSGVFAAQNIMTIPESHLFSTRAVSAKLFAGFPDLRRVFQH